MANYPIKILIDEQGKEFVPFVNTDVVYFPDGSTLSNALDTKADKTTMASELDKKADWGTTLSAYGITDAYTKQEIEDKLAAVYNYKGSVNTYAELSAKTDNKTGDVWNVVNDETSAHPEEGANYAWNGTTWDKLGAIIDLSPYATTAFTDETYLQVSDITAATTGNVKITKTENKCEFEVNIIDNLTSTDAHAALSANQGKVLAERVAPAGGQTNQVLAKVSDSNYDMAWVKAADPNSIIGDGSIVKIVEITYDEYLALQDAGQIDPDVEYHIADYDGDNISTIGETAIQTMIDRSIQDHVTYDVEGQDQPVHALVTAVNTDSGFMSGADKIKLDSMDNNAVSLETINSQGYIKSSDVDTKISTATSEFVSETDIDAKIDEATKDFISGTEVDSRISTATSDFVTNAEAQALVSNGVADKITTTAAQTMVDNAVNDLVSTSAMNTAISNATAEFITLSDTQTLLTNSLVDYKIKGDFVTIKGTATIAANTEENQAQDIDMQTLWAIDFPTGFTMDNCVCISYGARFYETRGYCYGYNTSSSLGMIKGSCEHTVVLGQNNDTSKIQMEAYNPASSERTIYYVLTLMKI